MNNEQSVNTTTIETATAPVPSPGDALRANAYEQSFKLLHSAYNELGVVMAVQTSYLGYVREPSHVHELRAEPREDLIARLHAVICVQPSTEIENLPVYQELADEGRSLDAEYHRLLELHTVKPGAVSLKELKQLTCRLGHLSKEIMTRFSDSGELWDLFEKVAVDVKDCLFLHTL